MVRATETFKSQMLGFNGKNISIIIRNKRNIYQNQTQFRRPNSSTIKKNHQPAKYNNTLTFNNLPRLLPKLYHLGTKHNLPPLPWMVMGAGGLNHFSEGLYTRELCQIGISSGNWHFRRKLFFSGET